MERLEEDSQKRKTLENRKSIKYFKTMINTIKRYVMFLALTLISVVAVYFTFTYLDLIYFSTFSVAVAKVAMAVMLFWIIDSTLLSEINIIDEIKNNNITYGLFVLGLWICIGLLISTA
jgi:hypothetical protein